MVDSQEIKHRNKSKLCFFCNELSESVQTIPLSDRGYGSLLDSKEYYFQFCEHCLSDDYKMWITEKPSLKEFTYSFQYEGELLDLIESMPIENQEYLYNDYMERNDWIAMMKGLLGPRKFWDYYLQTPEEVEKNSFLLQSDRNAVITDDDEEIISDLYIVKVEEQEESWSFQPKTFVKNN